MIFSAKIWNEYMAFARRYFPRTGTNCRLSWTPDGTIVSALDALEGEDHPWRHRCFTELVKEGDDFVYRWRVAMTPGFVSGRDATMEEVVRDRDGNIVERFQTALTADPAPSLVLEDWRDPLRSGTITATAEGELRAAPGEGYPRFFDRLGVKPAAAGGDPTKPGSIDPGEDELRTRELRALDTQLVVPRIAAAQDVELLNPATVAQAIRISTRFLNDYVRNARAAYDVSVTTKWSAPREPDALERLQGVAIEPQFDTIKLATIWMVSLPGAGPDAVPDETWTPYVQPAVWRNLLHASHALPPALPPSEPITINTGLLFGIADFLFNSLLNPINDQNAQITGYLAGTDFKGDFWSI